MDRLTTRNSEGVAVLKTPYKCDRCGEEIYRLADCGNGEPIEKLARYEELQDRLNKKFNGCISIEELVDSFVEFYDQQEKDEELAVALLIVNDDVRKYQEWEILEEQGKLLKLPCKEGDTVYYITGYDTHSSTPQFNRVEKSKVQGFYFDEKGVQIRLNADWVGNHGTYGYFGKTVFLTQEEAEAALKEMEGTE